MSQDTILRRDIRSSRLPRMLAIRAYIQRRGLGPAARGRKVA